MKNTNIAYTVREIAPDSTHRRQRRPDDSVDILYLAGCSHVFQFMNMLGQSLARRTLGARTRSNVIGRFEKLVIAEAPVMRTRLVGKSIRARAACAKATGITIVGLWKRGHFRMPTAETALMQPWCWCWQDRRSSWPDLRRSFGRYQTNRCFRTRADPGGRPGGYGCRQSLREQNVVYRIVEKIPGSARARQYV